MAPGRTHSVRRPSAGRAHAADSVWGATPRAPKRSAATPLRAPPGVRPHGRRSSPGPKVLSSEALGTLGRRERKAPNERFGFYPQRERSPRSGVAALCARPGEGTARHCCSPKGDKARSDVQMRRSAAAGKGIGTSRRSEGSPFRCSSVPRKRSATTAVVRFDHRAHGRANTHEGCDQDSKRWLCAPAGNFRLPERRSITCNAAASAAFRV